MKLAVVLLSSFALVACASRYTYWDKPGATQDLFEQELGQCNAQAQMAPNPYSIPIALNSCMRGKGWKQISR